MVCLLAASLVQLFFNAGNGCGIFRFVCFKTQHHKKTLIRPNSCQSAVTSDTLLFLSLTHVSSAMASVQTFNVYRELETALFWLYRPTSSPRKTPEQLDRRCVRFRLKICSLKSIFVSDRVVDLWNSLPADNIRRTFSSLFTFNKSLA